MTNSEVLAIKLLQSLRAKVSVVPTESKENKQTPDLIAFFSEHSIVVEVKEITVNPSEKEVVRQAEAGQVTSIDKRQDSKRFAAAIRSANRQLKTKCNGRPGLVLLQDLRGFWMQAIDPQRSIHQAMFGEETLWLTQPFYTDAQPTRLVSHVFGGGRTVNAQSNTTTSAVGLMLPREGGQTTLWLHHNPFAAIPLPRGTFRGPLVREFVVSSTNRFASFSEVTP
jgi:hypothetical protein